MEVDPTRMCELLVGLPDVNLLGVVDAVGEPLRVHIETRRQRPICHGCSGAVVAKDRDRVELVDLPAFGRPTRMVWCKRRWSCPAASCPVGSFTETDTAIAPPRLALTDRAGRMVTEQVCRGARTVNEVAVELGCDWHPSSNAVPACGDVWWLELGDRERPEGIRAMDPSRDGFQVITGSLDALGKDSALVDNHPEAGEAGCRHWRLALPAGGGAVEATLVHDFEDLRSVEGVADGPAGHAVYVVDVDARVDMRFLAVD